MRLLVTGSTGFLGSHVVRRLLRDDHAVAVVVRAGGNRWRVADVLAKLAVIEGDLANLAAVRSAVRDFAPESVIHLAWSGVGNLHRNAPAQVTNVAQGVELLELSREAGAKAWIGLGSQAEYGPSTAPTDERAPTVPTTIYGIAKLSTCLFAQRLCEESGLRFAWVRVFSTYGPKDDPGWMVPYLIGALLRGERPKLTAGEQRWDYLYADDAAEAIVRVALGPEAEGIFNLGSGRATPLRTIIEKIRDLIDPSLPLGFGEVPYRPDQVMHLQADIARLRDITDWSPQIDLTEGLRRTIAWVRESGAKT
jgi:UDP-glucose 4-epimerase